MLKCGVWTFFSRSPQLVRVPLKKKKRRVYITSLKNSLEKKRTVRQKELDKRHGRHKNAGFTAQRDNMVVKASGKVSGPSSASFSGQGQVDLGKI